MNKPQCRSRTAVRPVHRRDPALQVSCTIRANSGERDERYVNNRGGERDDGAPSGPPSEVKTKLMEIRQKVDKNRAGWIRLGYEGFSRRTILLASEEKRQAGCRKIEARP